MYLIATDYLDSDVENTVYPNSEFDFSKILWNCQVRKPLSFAVAGGQVPRCNLDASKKNSCQPVTREQIPSSCSQRSLTPHNKLASHSTVAKLLTETL